MGDARAVWIDQGIEALRREFPQLADDATALGTRLADLICDRVPRLADARDSRPGDSSIGYPTLVERGRFALGCATWEGTELETEDLAQRAADCFLKAAGGAIDPPLREEVVARLPRDLSSRMFARPGRT